MAYDACACLADMLSDGKRLTAYDLWKEIEGLKGAETLEDFVELLGSMVEDGDILDDLTVDEDGEPIVVYWRPPV